MTFNARQLQISQFRDYRASFVHCLSKQNRDGEYFQSDFLWTFTSQYNISHSRKTPAFCHVTEHFYVVLMSNFECK